MIAKSACPRAPTALFLACLATLPLAAGAAVSQPATFFANAPESYLWHSIPSGDTTVYWDMPETAHSATITIKGAHSTRVLSGLTGESCVLSIPSARDTKEDVFKITLAFDNGTVRTAYLGAVTGLGSGGMVTTPRVRLSSTPEWSMFQDYAAIAVPQGATALTVNGEPLPDLDGNAGWRLLHYNGASEYALALTLKGEDSPLLATVTGIAGGTVFYVR